MATASFHSSRSAEQSFVPKQQMRPHIRKAAFGDLQPHDSLEAERYFGRLICNALIIGLALIAAALCAVKGWNW